MFGLERAELDLISLKESLGDTAEIIELEQKAKALREELMLKAANATPRVIDYGDSLDK